MAQTYLQLKFKKDDPASLAGSAWIMLGGHELSQDCGSIGELERVVATVRADLDGILASARVKFGAA
jgi:hypothetical protein